MVFEEKQTMGQLWWMFITLPMPLVIIFTVWLAEKDPAEKQEIFSAMLLVLAVELLVVLLIRLMKLESRIDRDGVSFRYAPFIKTKKYLWADIEKAGVQKYKPIAEYGGWGIKAKGFKSKNVAYNVWGNKGLQLELKDGKKILVGTQKAAEMAAFLNRLKERYTLPQIEEEKLNG